MKNLITLLGIVTLIVSLYSFSNGERELRNEIEKSINHNNTLMMATNNEVLGAIEIVEKPKVVAEKVIEKVEVKNLTDFTNAIGFKESTNRYHIVNSLGYKGRYQLGGSTLVDLEIRGRKDFLNNEKLQDMAFHSYLRVNKYRLRKYTKYIGTTINGIKITESGMLAAAHLVGAKSVRIYLNSGGKKIRKDANKMSLETYLKQFGGYTLNINAKRKINLKKYAR